MRGTRGIALTRVQQEEQVTQLGAMSLG